jgi:hypothetical protein
MRVFSLLLMCALMVTASAFAAPTPAPSPVSSAAPPGTEAIKILACGLEYNSLNGVASKMHVDFMNLSALPVTHIRFRVVAGLSEFAVMDVGRFAPNLKIHHDLDPPMARVPASPAITMPRVRGGLYCGIDAYTLTDGYTWISPQLQVELEQQQQQKHP